MPELPDVEYFKTYLDSTSLHQKIDDVEVHDTAILKGTTERTLKSRIRNRKFASARRHGKCLFVEIQQDGWLVLHFGMTGFLDYSKGEELTPHARVVFRFANGSRLAYDCQRKIGHVSLTDDVEAFIADHELGPDALDPALDFESFRDCLEGRRGSIKSTLMNQKVLAGVGNDYSDEILFQSGIRPQRKIDRLNDATLAEIYRTMRRVLRVAARHRADPDRMPRGYLLPHRKKDGCCPRCGETLKQQSVSGRTAVYCEKCQS